MSSKFKHIQVKSNDGTKKNRNLVGKPKVIKKLDGNSSNNDKKTSKLNKSLELEERRTKKKNKEINESNDDNPKAIRYNSQAKRKVNKTIDQDNYRTMNSNSYEKRNIKTNNEINENKKIKKGIKKLKAIKKDNDREDEDDSPKFKKIVKKTKTDTKQTLNPIKKVGVAKKVIRSQKNDKSNTSFDIKINKTEINNKNGKKLISNKTAISKIPKKKTR